MGIEGANALLTRLATYEEEFGTEKVSTGAFISSTVQVLDALANISGGGGPGGCQCTTELAAIETAVQTADTNIVAANAATELAVTTADTNIVAANAATATAVGDAETAIVAANAATATAVGDAETAIVAANAATETAVQTADANIVEAILNNKSPHAIFQGQSGHSEALLWSDQLISGSVTSSQNNATAETLLTTSLNTAGRRIRQSLKRFPCQLGVTHVVECTFVMKAGVSGNTKKVGYFDDRNGFFLQQDGTEVSFNRRTYTSGSAVNNKVVQASWNLDTFDGTGASGITLDLTKIQTFVVDFSWVGRVRVGFVVSGVVYYCHQFLSENVLTLVPTSTCALPIRFEIEHSGTGSGSSLSCINGLVKQENDFLNRGSPGGRWSGVQGTISSGNNAALLGLRLKAAHAHGPVVSLDSLTYLATTSGVSFAWYVLRNPTVTGTFTYNGIANTSVEVATGGALPTVTLSGADIIIMGIGYGQTPVEVNLKNYGIQLETEADATVIPLVFAVYANNNLSMGVAARWRQIG